MIQRRVKLQRSLGKIKGINLTFLLVTLEVKVTLMSNIIHKFFVCCPCPSIHVMCIDAFLGLQNYAWGTIEILKTGIV